MRIIVNGQQAFGKSVLEALLERGEEVVGVYCAPEKEGQRADPLKEYAVERGLPVFQPRSYRKEEVWEQIASLKPDLCVMAYVTLFVPEEALAIPTHGSIQYHPSLLPLHRGPSSINWPIIWGEKRTGLTIFWPDNGLDEGPILLQKEVEIGDEDTLGSLYFNHLFPLGVQAMLEGVDLVREGRAPRVDQDHTKATYEGWCKPEHVEIRWNMPLQATWNMIRGADPQPGAWTRFEGKEVKIFDSRKVMEARSVQPGQVTAIDGEAITVAAPDGQLRIERVRPQGAKKMTAAEWAAAAGIKVGARLGV
ncbi:MAG: methionyl-tRNA formyltransferase [Ectothiorhodospiraceae bacterium]|nr:methionyl-tRNA formyltransferase [Chromatiales bacterium]MCP5157289.1 methionyl-tRNA formyltransferase [Ectothiorhodospiraceae bacterium]